MTFEWSVIWSSLPVLLQGTKITIVLTVATMAISIPIGIVVMLLRTARNGVLRAVGTTYVEVLRNIPLILLAYWVFYVLPLLLDVRFPPFLAGLISLTVIISAYNAENFRAGVNSIRRGQTDAALALGMSRAQVMQKVVLPQASRRVLPILANTWVSLFKDTTLVSVIGVQELAYTALQVRTTTFRVLEILTAMMVIYWLLGYPQAKLVDWLHRKYGVAE
jgi:polar amino acid transport system permease protein